MKKEVSKKLSEATRLLQRRQLELEQSLKYRDLLSSEGAAASREELEQSKERVKKARESFLSLKNEHSLLLTRAQILGKSGFPEVWKGVPVLRGGALLTIDSFSNVEWLRSPDVRVGEKDGRKFVLKSRVITDKKDRSKFEKEVFILQKLKHPLIIQIETVFTQGDLAFLVLPFMEDGTMKEWIQKAKPVREQLKETFRGVVQGLQAIFFSFFFQDYVCFLLYSNSACFSSSKQYHSL